MTADVKQVALAGRGGRASGLMRRLARVPRVVPTLLFIVWVVLPLVPEETGLRFGLGFQVFFTICLILSAIFFWFIRLERVPCPGSPAGVFASVAGTYLATIGLLVALAAASPQFGLPRPPREGVSQEAATRGQALFTKAEVGCFLCHSISGRGGTRGPDLTGVSDRAGDRVPGLPAERYLREKVKAGSTYQFTAPGYVPIMPPFGERLSEEQVADLVAYLLSPK